MNSKKYNNITVIADPKNQTAQEIKQNLVKNYNFSEKIEQQTDLIIALGGDGTILHLLHQNHSKIPIYGVNCGTVGFLTNEYSPQILQNIDNAKKTDIHPLKMLATTTQNQEFSHIAINEVSLLRQSSQTSKIKIKINDQERLDCLCGDGVLISTPAGSTAYNMSCRGPIIPLASEILALTPISPFRPRNWHGAILPASAKIEFEIINPEKRPTSATADFTTVNNIKKVTIHQDNSTNFTLLFNADHSLEERIIREQFKS